MCFSGVGGYVGVSGGVGGSIGGSVGGSVGRGIDGGGARILRGSNVGLEERRGSNIRKGGGLWE